MPELPEVEASRVLIDRHCTGRTVTDVDAADDTKVFDGASAPEVVAAFKGRRLDAVGRKGKQLWMELSGSGPCTLLHFGMTGYVAVKEPSGSVHVLAYENAPHDDAAWPPRFHKLLLTLECGGQLAYCDARRFGKIRLVEGPPAACEAVAKLGFDGLTELPPLPEFAALLRGRAKGAGRLKPLLLDQSFCAGVGNWVADEVLWQARLHPEQLVAALGDEHVAALHGALRDVLHTAVAADADSSKFPPGWMFHVRWGKQAGKLEGHRIDHITVGSRTSCFVPALQKLISDDGGGKGGGSAGRASKKAGAAAAPAAAAAAAAAAPEKQKQKKRGAAGSGGSGVGEDAADPEPEGGHDAAAGVTKKSSKRAKTAAAPPKAAAAAAATRASGRTTRRTKA